MIYEHQFAFRTFAFIILAALIIAGPAAAYLNQNLSIDKVNGKLNLWSLSLLKTAIKTPTTSEIATNLAVIYLFYLINDKLLLIGAITYFGIFTSNKIAVDLLKDSALIKSLSK